MLFRDLMRLECDDGGRIQSHELTRLLPDTPDDVLQDLYADHGRKQEFQDLYGDWDLCRISWKEVHLNAIVLCGASINPEFNPWYECVKHRPISGYQTQGFSVIDTRKDVVAHWSKHRTWRRAPICVDKSLIQTQSTVHVVEGHTRVATLNGLVQLGIIQKDSEHRVWLGSRQQDQ